jgi:ABC-type sugar transport system permease subunit
VHQEVIAPRLTRFSRFRDHGPAMANRLVSVCVAVGLALTAAPPLAVAADSSAQRLVARYSPIVAFRQQEEPCGTGEAYRPTSVDLVLGNPEVALRDATGQVVTKASTASDLWGLGEGYYLDLPGDPLEPGCGYEEDFRRWSAGMKPSVYAHVATDPSHPGKLAVQYWLYYTFNDFTDKHESDWEMAQADFAAATPRDALRKGPYEVALSQHAGGERSDWSNTKLEKQGTHPVIYAATGSHANYFGSALYLGRGASEGFGCDDTRDADTRVRLQTTLLPGVPASASNPYAWLGFDGRWGQQEKGLNSGPTGPATKGSWSAPIDWADGLRDQSVRVPETPEPLGLSATSFFCGAVTQGSIVLNWTLVHPWAFLALVGLLTATALGAVGRTTWRPPDPHPLRKARGGGQIFRAARRLYGNNLAMFAAMGAIFLPVALITAAIQWVIFHLTPIGSLVALDGRGGAVTAFVALVTGGIGAAMASVITTAAVAFALGEIDAGRKVRGADAFRAAFERLRALVGATARQYAAAVLLTITVVGVPFAIGRYVRWSLFAEACALEDRTARGSLRRSAELVRGRWWRTFGFTALVVVLAALSGPLLGVALLLLTDRSLNFINIAGALVYTITVPYAAIALTLYYFDLEARRRTAVVEQP